MPDPLPVAGYPSQRAAVVALMEEGLDLDAIVARTGLASKKVSALMAGERFRRRQEAKRPLDDTRGLWTPEKLDKARRLVAQSMEIVAEALQVPAEELLKLIVSGTIPPVGGAQRIGDLRNRFDDAAQAGDTVPPPVVKALAAPTAAARPVQQPAQGERPAKFRLRSPDGEYLNENERTLTRLNKFFWRGTADEVARLKRRNPKWRELTEEACA